MKMRVNKKAWEFLRMCFMAFVILFLPSLAQATLPERPKLPLEFSTTVMAIKETNGRPGAPFEYEVSFTALFDLEEVHLYISKPDMIVFDEEPKEFKGSMKKRETISWRLKGVMKDIIKFDTGETLHPPIRLEGSYRYPYEDIRAEITQNYTAEKQSSRGPFMLEQTLQYLDSLGFKEKIMKINKIWVP
jgi:hypothetical protein